MAVAKYTKSTLNSKTVHYIEADLSTINIEDLGGKVLTSSTSTKFGINGTFFDDDSKKIFGIACTSGGTAVRDYGTSAVYTRGTMYCYRPVNGTNKTVSVSVIKQLSDTQIPLEWFDWAISGLNMYLSDSNITNESTLTNKLDTAEHGSSVNGVVPSAARDRSAIGYKKSTGKIFLANIISAKPYEVRQVMKSLGCDEAIMLDGSNASQLRAKNASGGIITNGSGRNIYSIITVNNATWQ